MGTYGLLHREVSLNFGNHPAISKMPFSLGGCGSSWALERRGLSGSSHQAELAPWDWRGAEMEQNGSEVPSSSGVVHAFTAQHQDGCCERGLTPEAPSFISVQCTAAFRVSFSPWTPAWVAWCLPFHTSHFVLFSHCLLSVCACHFLFPEKSHLPTSTEVYFLSFLSQNLSSPSSLPDVLKNIFTWDHK